VEAPVGAFVEYILHLPFGLIVEVRVPEDSYVEAMEGRLKVRMVGVQERDGLSATADSLNPEEIRHSSPPQCWGIFPHTMSIASPQGYFKPFSPL
jgi:hypothetical protein